MFLCKAGSLSERTHWALFYLNIELGTGMWNIPDLS